MPEQAGEGIATSAGTRTRRKDAPALTRSPRKHPTPWVVQETTQAFRIIDADGHLLAEIPFATGLGQGLSRDAARQMADRMLASGEVLTRQNVPSRDGCGG